MNATLERQLKDYAKLKAKLLATLNGVPPSEIAQVNPLSADSKKHHYIPVHFIQGFLGNNGLLFRYDKSNDRIIKNPQGSNGVFFELHRNSVTLPDDTRIPLFEHYYSVVDNLLPFAIKLLRSDHQFDGELIKELFDHLNIFLIDLYWRNINTDSTFDTLYESSNITMHGLEPRWFSIGSVEDLKKLPGFRQLIRIYMVQSTMNHAIEYFNKNKNNNALISFESEEFCLGDMPFISKTKPTKHTELSSLPLLLPISSNKLYLRNIDESRQWNVIDATMFNALTIHHSSKMVVCANKQVLELAINTYHSAKERNLFSYIQNRLFGA